MRGKFFIILYLCALAIKAQISPVEQAVEYLVEFGQTENANPDLVQLSEQLTYLQNNPISLNEATADEILEIPLLNSFQVFGIIEYRKRSGKILSYYQLSDIKGLSTEIIKLLKHFTTLKPKQFDQGFPKQLNHQVAVQYRRLVQRVRGSKTGQYQGDASAAYLRYRLQGEQKLFAGITAQKDAGEAWLTNNQPDFWSVHFEYRPNKLVKNVLIGDYSVEFGQGLVLWSSLAFNKSSEAVSIERFGRGVRHYTGADENRFMRGAATTLQLGKWNFSAFYSLNSHDANIVESENGDFVASSLQNAGTHRTENERIDKDALQIQTAGTYIQWRPSRFRMGFLSNSTSFSIPIQFADRPENLHRFSGSELLHTSLDLKWLYGRLFAFGEFGYEWAKNASAITAGLKVLAADELQWIVQFRHLSKSWFAPLSQPFAESGGAGETGIYLGLNWQINHRFKLAAFADHYQYAWLRTTSASPSFGRDYVAQLNFSEDRLTMYLRGRIQERPRTLNNEDIIRKTGHQKRISARWHSSYSINNRWALQTRFEIAKSEHLDHSFGSLFYFGLRYNATKRWQIRARYTLFDTQDFSSAIYAFEDDLPYNFSVPAFSDQGTRWYLMITYQINRKVEFWLRLADTYYPNLETLGSGNEQIEGARRTTLKAMIRMSF